MKKFFLLVLCAILLITGFVSCDREEEIASTLPEELESYRKLSNFTERYFSVADSNTALEVRLPIGWSLEEENGHFKVLDGKEVVGTVFSGEGEEEMTLATTKEPNGITVKTYVGALTRDGEKQAYYRVVFSFRDSDDQSRVVSMEIKESAMDGSAMQWMNGACVRPIKGYHDIPTLSLLDGNQKQKILILGNSFVSSSHSAIATILKEMIAAGNQQGEVEYFSLGYATVSQYAREDGNFADARERIATGNYNMVLMCGLYSSADVEALRDMIALCDTVNTRLVLFPAHNEGASHIESALAKYRNMPCLNWKREIDTLLDLGLSRSLLCKEDQHGHSTNLGGYIGAHLVYRSLYGEVPPTAGYATDAIVQDALIQPLGSYVSEGMQLLAQTKINRLF
ncbi:MAG: hypothetical protein E7585_07750 [Ruminococcaceae bacterium]|nr:hypothetical protein [Oscillospiraceae bacterium]